MDHGSLRNDDAVGMRPVDDLRRRLDAAVGPVAPTAEAPFAAVGAVLAEDLIAPHAHPRTATALRSGFAVASFETVGASPYAPVTPDRAIAVAVGETLPDGCDAVLPVDTVVRTAGTIRISDTVAPWTGALPAGADVAAGAVLAHVGERVGPLLADVAQRLGIAALPVRRPRIAVAHDGSPDAITAARTLVSLLPGVAAAIVPCAEIDAAAADLDLMIGLGDLAARDPAVARLAGHGRIDGFGLALSPGEAIAWGLFGARPVLVLPRRLDEVVAATLVVVAPLIRRLAGAAPPSPLPPRPLARKISSRVGFTEVALLAGTADGGWRPLGVGRFSWPALLAAEAWLELGPESEGCPEGAIVHAAPLDFHRPSVSGDPT